jgi:PhoD related phosphatase
VAEALASIPSVNMWDDHDIIDGYGSYPNDMQNTDLFQGKQSILRTGVEPLGGY